MTKQKLLQKIISEIDILIREAGEFGNEDELLGLRKARRTVELKLSLSNQYIEL